MSHLFMLWAYRDGEEGISKRARIQGLSSQHHKGLHLLHHEVIKFYPQCVETPHFSHRWPGRKSIAFLITDCASLLLDPWHLCPKLAQRSPWGFIDAWAGGCRLVPSWCIDMYLNHLEPGHCPCFEDQVWHPTTSSIKMFQSRESHAAADHVLFRSRLTDHMEAGEGG